jgi:transposase-like protein
MEPMGRPSKYSPELRERAVRMVFDHAADYTSEWAAMRSIAEKFGCTTEGLRRWVRQAERDTGQRRGLTTDAMKTWARRCSASGMPTSRSTAGGRSGSSYGARACVSPNARSSGWWTTRR